MSTDPASPVKRYAALLRGINVGGHHLVRMADLKDLALSLGFTEPRTYLQSGNLVFEATQTPEAELAGTLAEACHKRYGFPVPVMIRSDADFAAEAAGCPYAGADAEPLGGRLPKLLHLGFFQHAPDPERVAAVLSGYAGPEEFALKDRVMHLYFTEGPARSRLSPLLSEARLGAPMTMRNWNSVQALKAMLAA